MCHAGEAFGISALISRFAGVSSRDQFSARIEGQAEYRLMRPKCGIIGEFALNSPFQRGHGRPNPVLKALDLAGHQITKLVLFAA